MKIQIYSCNASAILLKAKMDERVVQKIFIIVQKIVEFLYLQNFPVFLNIFILLNIQSNF